MLLNTGRSKKHRRNNGSEIKTLTMPLRYCCISHFLIHGLTSCHVETNHWTLRCFWQRLMKQASWLVGFGRPAHKLSGSVCAWTPGLVLVHSAVLFLTPLPHLREHCQTPRRHWWLFMSLNASSYVFIYTTVIIFIMMQQQHSVEYWLSHEGFR